MKLPILHSAVLNKFCYAGIGKKTNLMKKVFSPIFFMLVFGLLSGSAFAQFSGAFAPGNWTYSSTTAGGDGSINTSGAPSSVVLSGSDNNVGCCSLYENWAITIA